MITEPIKIEQVIVICDHMEFGPMALEALLHTLRKHGRVELQMYGHPASSGHVPTACELAINVLQGVGATVNVSGPQLEEMNRQMHDALV